MNFNALIATLVIKGIITKEEGEALVAHLHDKPQSTVLRDVIKDLEEVIEKPKVAIMDQIKVAKAVKK